MAKHSFEFNLRVVMDYLDSEGTAGYLSKKYGVPDDSQVKKWINQYNQVGDEGLRKKMSKTSYSDEFKLSELQCRQFNKTYYRETENYFNINNPSLLANWQR